MVKISEQKLNFQTIVFIDGDLDKSASVEELERIMDKLLVERENEIILNTFHSFTFLT